MVTMRTFRVVLTAGVLALTLPAAAFAAGSSSTSTGNSDVDANYSMAKTAIAQFKYDEAKGYLEKVLAAKPDDADALNLMGLHRAKAGGPGPIPRILQQGARPESQASRGQ